METSRVSHRQKIQDINHLWEADGDCFGTSMVCFCCALLLLMKHSILPLIRPLSKNLRGAIQRKRTQMSDKRALLFHDNARPHSAHATVNLLERWGWEILEHPPYSPDLAPSDFHLFPPHEKNIFVRSDSNHMMMSNTRYKHGCVVRIPPSIDRILRNRFPA